MKQEAQVAIPLVTSEFSRPSRAGLIEASSRPRRPATWPCFPALHGRASLKRRPPAGAALLARRAFSRPSRAGLIEAAHRKSLSAACPEFSRPSRAGLIEAGRSRRGRGRPAACFPALHGRASLKRARPRRRAARLRRFPALHGRASLKRAAFRRADRGDRGFPALHGRASLKHDPAGRVAGRVDRFPALHGRASLKRGQDGGSGRTLAAFSRPSRAGLIEAAAAD